jgi:ornithine carbamoyltransferase
MDLFGRDLIVTQEWNFDELMAVLRLATEMKRDRFNPRFAKILEHRTFFMFFYNPSVRTRQSFECAATELGGHAQFLQPEGMRLRTATTAGETVEDAAKVMSRYAAGIGIRVLEDKVPYYGAGNALLREYAKWASVPLINMADDKYHPCQGLADIMGWGEWLGRGPGRPGYDQLRGKNFLLTWASGALARSWCSVQEAMLIASRFGMNVTVARPDGYDLDPEVYAWTKANCEVNGATFRTISDPEEGYQGAHVVYSRNWVTSSAYQDGEFRKEAEKQKSASHTGWTTTAARMARTDNAIFTHPMPVDRGLEVSDEVASGARSAIYDIAENRLHVQKAIMALTMAKITR